MQTVRSNEQLAGGSLWWGALLAMGVASISNALVFAMAQALGVALRVSMASGQSPQPLPFALVIFASVVPALLAAGLLALLDRLTDRPVRLFQWISAGLALLSLVPPMLQAEGAAAKLILVIMHLIAAAAIIGVLSRVKRRA